MIKNYIEITKPGIIRGNLIVAAAVFIYASAGHIVFIDMLALLVGMGLIIGSAASANNYLDIDIDSKMQRTKNRAMASGAINAQSALVYSAVLGLLGVILLLAYINLATAAVGIASFVLYVFVYGYFKRRSIHGTLVGAIPGAAPPLAGYLAVNNLDWLAILLFFILIFWQMPHFYAIAIMRKKDYQKAGLPVMPIVKGNKYTKKLIILYIGLFIFSLGLLFSFNKAGVVFFIVMLAGNIWWVKLAYDGLSQNGPKYDIQWAKSMFKVSLLILVIYSTLLALNNYLP